MSSQYSNILLALSFGVSLIASYISLSLATVLRRSEIQTNKWPSLISSSVTLGMGVWSMHYIGMLSFPVPDIQIGYDVTLMVISIVVAVLGALISIYFVASKTQSERSMIVGSILFAISALIMHYLGMLAMQVTTNITWNIDLIILSMFVVVFTSIVAMFFTRKHNGSKKTRKYIAIASVVLGTGIAIMHNLGMCAAHFEALYSPPPPGRTILLANSDLNYSVLISTTIIFFISLISTWLSQVIQTKEKQLKEIHNLYKAAEAANHTKTRFVANMSHEIRTPLTAIIGFTELLRSEHDSEEAREQYIDIIQKSANSLVYLIDDILDLSSIEMNHLKISISAFNIRSLLTDIVNLVEMNARKKDIEVHFEVQNDVPEFIKTDKSRLRQIILNLVNNSLKFTKVGSVKIEVTRNRVDQLTFRVIDTGIGISPENQKHVFKAFYQVDSSNTREFHGAGLGLDISQRLATALEGTLSLESSVVNQGTVFRLNLPLLAVTEGDLPRQQPVFKSIDKPLRGYNILLVEDVEDNQFLICRILEKRGAKVSVAENGKTGIKKALSENYDLVLMDIQMPQMDGLTAARKLRKQGYTTPIIALTAHAMTDERNNCLQAGFTEYLTKPINIDEMIDIILQLTAKGIMKSPPQ